jgi:hypothetical protein
LAAARGSRSPTQASTTLSPTAVTEPKQFEGRGHSLTIDNGWREVADATLEWLEATTGQRELAAAVTARAVAALQGQTVSGPHRSPSICRAPFMFPAALRHRTCVRDHTSCCG